MRILMLNDYRTKGGAETVVETECALLSERGHQVEILLGEEVMGRAPRGPVSYVTSWRAVHAVRRALRAFSPDVVHVHNLYHLLSPAALAPLRAWKRPGRGVVMTCHDFNLVCPDPAGRRFRRGAGLWQGEPCDPASLRSWWTIARGRWDERSVARSILRSAQHLWNYRVCRRRRAIDRLICPGPDAAAFLAAALGEAAPPIDVIPNPAPPAIQTPSRGERGPLRLIFAGRIEPEKGIRRLLEIWPADPSFELEIVGAGSDEPGCRAVVDERRLPVRFEGRLEHAEVLERMAHAHAVVLPSLTDETEGLVLYEGLSRGASLLVNDRGAMRRAVRETGEGEVFEAGDAESLRAALDRLVRSRAAGTLNAFDCSAVLGERRPAVHVERLEAVYRAVTGTSG